MSASQYIEELQANGRYSFAVDEAARALGSSLVATRAALRRLKRKGALASPHQGFQVVVPPEYRRLGCLPAEQFIPDLMAFLNEPYYVGLLSAAAYHEAAHQTPMVFQVIVPSSRRSIECGKVKVDFIARQDMPETSVIERNTPRGILRVASPEATAVELVGYPEHSGYFDNIATVLAELTESIDPQKLVQEARRAPLAWIQRLGYLLCLVDEAELAGHLEVVLSERSAFVVALAPWKSMQGAPRDPRWRVAINIKVEPDL